MQERCRNQRVCPACNLLQLAGTVPIQTDEGSYEVADFDEAVGTTIPHSCFGDPECCGCFNGLIRGDRADIECNECGFVCRNVPVSKLQETLTDMELTLDVASATCPYCGSVNLFPGFSEMFHFTCRQCGEGVDVKI